MINFCLVSYHSSLSFVNVSNYIISKDNLGFREVWILVRFGHVNLDIEMYYLKTIVKSEWDAENWKWVDEKENKSKTRSSAPQVHKIFVDFLCTKSLLYSYFVCHFIHFIMLLTFYVHTVFYNTANLWRKMNKCGEKVDSQKRSQCCLSWKSTFPPKFAKIATTVL